MDQFVGDPFDHIGEEIFDYLTNSDLLKCRLVCEKWKNFVNKRIDWCQKCVILTARKKFRKLSYEKYAEWETIFRIVSLSCEKSEILLLTGIILDNVETQLSKEEDKKIFTVPILKMNTIHMDFIWTYYHAKEEFYEYLSKVHTNQISWIENFMIPKIRNIMIRNGWIVDSYLFIAAKYNHVKIYEEMVTRLEDVNPAKTNGETPLHIAAKFGHEAIVSVIVENVEDNDNHPDKQGITPLHISVKQGFTNVTGILLSSASDKNPVDVNKITPLHLAVQNEDIDTVKLIVAEIDDRNPGDLQLRTPLHMASELNNCDIIEEIIFNVEDKNPKDVNGDTPLKLATICNNYEVVKFLLEEVELEDIQDIEHCKEVAENYNHIDLYEVFKIAKRRRLE